MDRRAQDPPALQVDSRSLVPAIAIALTTATLATLLLTHTAARWLGGPELATRLSAILAVLALGFTTLIVLRREARLAAVLERLLQASRWRLGEALLGGRADLLGALETVSRAHGDAVAALRERLARSEEHEREVQIVLERVAPPRFRHFLPGLEVAGSTRAHARAGGDYSLVRALDDRHVLIALGDVAGHDAASAYAAVALVGALRVVPSVALLEDLGHVLRQMEELLVDISAGTLTSSCVLMVIEQHTLRVRYVNAGHPAPWILRRGAPTAALSPSSGPLGLPRAREHQVQELELEAADRLLVLSDGVLEQSDAHGRSFGARRLERALRAALEGEPGLGCEPLLGAALASFDAFKGEEQLRDDVSMLVCRFVALRREQKLRLSSHG